MITPLKIIGFFMRAFVLLMDSFGLGGAPDAEKYGDVGADTFGSIVAWCAAHHRPLQIPNLKKLGLVHAAHLSTGKHLPGMSLGYVPTGAWGCASETSLGKDTPSGHWEIAGVPVKFEWGYFKHEYPCFPEELIADFIKETGVSGILGNKHASGTDIIAELGEKHMRTGMPIVYTSADSVFQIAAHEETFGLERLYEICYIARRLVDKYNVGRVIARPFLGTPGNFHRTGNRKDLSVLPPAPTLLDHLKAAGREVIAIGKVGDIYAHQGTTQEIKAVGNQELFDKTIEFQKTAPDGSLIFTNFVDFDMLYGHRRDVAGYAQALEDFDKNLGVFIENMQPDDVAVITADHGCDPTWPGSDHTRENVPMIFFGPSIEPKALGRSETFADIGQILANFLKVKALVIGNNVFQI